MRFLKQEGLLAASAQFVERHGLVVRHGPFAGVVYPRRAALNRHAIPKLLGIYEQELHGLLGIVAQRKYDRVIDIGSAEGYYAVGLARMLKTKVMAYDPEPIERSLCREGSRLNGVAELVNLKNLFHVPDIQTYKSERVFCVCDCEGYETELFNANTVRDIAKWDLIIELHKDAEARLLRLPWPHRLQVITAVPRVESYVELEGLGDQRKLISEYRDAEQTWLWCESVA